VRDVASQLNRFLPDAVHHDIERLVESTRNNSPWLLALAIAAMLWTSSGAIGVIERCESRMLGTDRHSVFTGRVRNMALGALVALSFMFAAAGAPVIGDALRSVSLGSSALSLLFTTLGSITVFAVIYRYAPLSRMAWRAAFIGAIPAGIALQAVPYVIGLYFHAAAGFAAVRLFLLIAVLLLGLYVMAMVMLVGAGVAVRAERRARLRAQDRARLASPMRVAARTTTSTPGSS
jgi:membrane protein